MKNRADESLDRMREAAVIGQPITHTLSPAIFAFLAKALKEKNFVYSADEVAPRELGAFLKQIRQQKSWIGLNVTIPHKEIIMAELDEISNEARAVGAVNVIKKTGDKLKGYNTDVAGILATLSKHTFPEQSLALIFGAGGAARAAAYALGTLGFKRILIVNRNVARANQLAFDLSKIFANTRFEISESITQLVSAPKTPDSDIHLVINATPVGMSGVTSTEDPFKKFARLKFADGALAFDLIYQPADTPFLQLAAEKKIKTVGGIEMLVHQALASWATWLDVDVTALKLVRTERGANIVEALIEHLTWLLALRARPKVDAPNLIFLTGFMGAGKSVIAQQLSQRVGWSFIDTDHLIQREAGTSISELFHEKGESAFRTLERDAIVRACRLKHTVVSLGGGAIMDAGSQKEILKNGTLIYLDANPDTIEKRLSIEIAEGRVRPLLEACKTREERLDKITTLLDSRKSSYEKARIRIDTNLLTIDDVVRELESKVFGMTGGR